MNAIRPAKNPAIKLASFSFLNILRKIQSIALYTPTTKLAKIANLALSLNEERLRRF